MRTAFPACVVEDCDIVIEAVRSHGRSKGRAGPVIPWAMLGRASVP